MLLENRGYLKKIILFTSSLSQLIHKIINIVSIIHLPELMSLKFTLYLFSLKQLSLSTSRIFYFYICGNGLFGFNCDSRSNYNSRGFYACDSWLSRFNCDRSNRSSSSNNRYRNFFLWLFYRRFKDIDLL